MHAQLGLFFYGRNICRDAKKKKKNCKLPKTQPKLANWSLPWTKVNISPKFGQTQVKTQLQNVSNLSKLAPMKVCF